MALPELINLITIRNRKEIEIDDIKMLDLTDQVIVIKKQLEFSRPPIVVPKEFEGRPDLISKLVYGSEDHTDLLLFFNGYSNPLMIEAGMTLIVPDLNSMLMNVEDKQETDTENESKKNFNKKLPKKDEKRIRQLISKKTGVPVDQVDVRPPNIPAEGIKPTQVEDGKIILGTDVAERCKNELSETQNLSEIIREAVREKIAEITQVAAPEPVTIGKTKVKVSQKFSREQPIATPKKQSGEPTIFGV